MFGHFLKRALKQGSVNHDLVKTDPTAFTGIGHVRVNAHATTTPASYREPTTTSTPPTQRPRSTRVGFSHVVMSFEIPLPTVVDTARRFRAAGSQVVVNFSPVSEDARLVLPHTDVLVVNEAEAAALWLQVAGPDAAIQHANWKPWTCFAGVTAAPATSW